MKITTGPVSRPQRGVLYAPEGIGKSTLASLAPAPLFLDCERGTHHLNVARVEPQTLDEVHAILDQLGRGDEGFKTLIVDTIDWMEKRVTKGVCERHRKDSIEDFGYGKGFTLVAEEMSLILAKLDRVATRMHVVLLAHSEIKKYERPDLPPYDRYQLRLTKGVMPLIREWGDFVVFGNYETIVKGGEGDKAKAVRTRSRQLLCSHTATSDGKNRMGLGDVEEWGQETLLRLLGVSQSVRGGSPPTTPAPATKAARKAPPRAAAPAPSPEPEDHVPGLDSEQEQLAALLVPVRGATKAATEWCLKHRRIQDGQTYVDMDPSTRRRILADPTGFLGQLKKEGLLS